MDCRLAAEVRLLGGVLHAAHDDCQHHAGNQEDPYAVNGYLQVVWGGRVLFFLLRSWIGSLEEGTTTPQS